MRVSKTVKKPAPAPEAKKPKKPRRRNLKEDDWTYNDDARVYVIDPPEADVHKYTLVYLHQASGHPNDYFTFDTLNTPGLRVVLPKAPVFGSFYHGQLKKEPVPSSRWRLWYDYYHDPKDPNEDPSQGADAEELELDSEEEWEVEAERKRAAGMDPGKKPRAYHGKAPPKFSEFIKTVSPDSHSEIQIPKEAQVKKTIDRILAIIHAEAAVLGGDYSRIFIGGYSQGGTSVLHAAIHEDCPSLGGVFTCCSTLHVERVTAALAAPVKSTPFVLYAGAKDDIYPVMLLRPTVERLQAAGYQVDFREKNMDHCCNGNVGPADEVEERLLKQWIEANYQASSLGALMAARSEAAPLDAKGQEAAAKLLYSLLFGTKQPHNRRAEIMKHSCWCGAVSVLNKRVNKLSADDLAIVARFFGAESCAAPDLARFLAAPTGAGLAALHGSGPAAMDLDGAPARRLEFQAPGS